MTEWLTTFWPWIILVIDVVAVVSATLHAVLHKRDTRAVIGWVGLVWLAPIVGAVLYFSLGVNRIERKAVSLKVEEAWKHRHVYLPSPGDLAHKDQFLMEHPTLAGLANIGRQLTGKPVLPGNLVEPLADGDEAYPAMLEAIDSARSSVALSTYIFDCDRAGTAFQEALVKAQQRGVEVRVLIDHVGSRYSKPNMVHQLRKSGLQVAAFLPSRTPLMLKYANLRNHRKILVVDGHLGFTGGTNIREGHWLSVHPDNPVKCLHFKLEGPVVQHLQETFAIDWAFASGESLTGETWFPNPEHAGAVAARGVPDGPDEDFESLLDVMVGALSTATRHVRIVTPYFLPGPALLHALNVCAMRGVRVDIVLPERNNLLLVKWASATYYRQLLEKGCHIHLSPPPFDHSKLLVIDGIWSLIGSSNWDPRSLRLNFEFNVECYDEQLALKLEGLADTKSAAGWEVTVKELDRLGLAVRIRNGLARLFTPYL